MASSSTIQCSLIDDTFGPWAGACRDSFDFTLLFEESILTIPLLVILICVTPFRLLHLRQRSRKTITGFFLIFKLLAFTIYCTLAISLLVLWATNTTYKTRASTATAALSVIGALCLGMLIFSEHICTVRPSFIISTYLFFSTILDLARTRTVWLIGGIDTISIIMTTELALKCVMLLLESFNKRATLAPPYRSYPPEATSGVFSRSMFWWLNEMMLKGFRHVFCLEELFPLDNQLYSKNVLKRLHHNWTASGKHRKHSLAWSILKTMKWSLLVGVFPRCCMIGFTFAQPFLITRAILLASAPFDEGNQNVGYGLIGAYAIVYVGMTVSTGQYMHKMNRITVMTRGGMVAAIYQKTLTLSVADANPAAAITLMSTDVERISGGSSHLQETWANTIEVGIALYLIERQLGVACLIPLFSALASAFATAKTSALIGTAQLAWILAIQKRIVVTAGTLGAMKSIKLSGLTGRSFSIMRNLRIAELEASKKMRKILVWIILFTFTTPVLTPILSFMVFALIARSQPDSTLSVAVGFTSLSLFYLFMGPLNALLASVPNIAAALACCDRIQEYLLLETKADPRIYDEYSGSTDGSPLQSISNRTENGSEKSGLTQVSRASESIMVVHNGSIGWAETLLQEVNFQIQRGAFVAITGPTGSGKSTLLKGLLGELPFLGEPLHVTSLGVAYCDQTAWLPNETVQKSILGISDFDAQWYKSVIHACALEKDIEQWPQGDQLAAVGSKGATLSGGQKQRLALARAVYSRKEIIILDDVLNGLDAITENEVFHRLFGLDGLLRQHGRTVVLVTSSVLRLPYVDHVIVLGADGRIAQQGSFDELNMREGYITGLLLPKPDWRYMTEEEETKSEETASSSSLNGIVAATEATEEKDSKMIEANRSTGDLTVYKFYIDSIGALYLTVFLFFICAFVFSTSFPEVWVKWWTESNILQPNEDLGKWLGVYAALGVIALGTIIAGCWQVFIEIIPKSGLYFHDALANTVEKAKMSFFWTVDTGVTLNRFSQDLQLIDMELPMAALLTVIALVTCLAQVILIAVAAQYIAIIFPFCIGVFYMLQKYYLRTSRQLRFLDLESKSSLYSQLLESLSGLTTIRAFGWQRESELQNFKFLDVSQKPYYLLLSIQRWLNFTIDMIVTGMAFVLIILVVELRGLVSPGFTGIALLNVMTFNYSLKAVINAWTSLETSIGSVSRIRTFAASTESEDKPEECQQPPKDWPNKGSIEIRGLSASYRTSEPILKNVSMSIGCGEKIGIVGRTGSGKSSLILCLLRMLELDSGSIIVDGFDICTAPREVVRQNLVTVAQDSYTFLGSVQLNADPSETASATEVISVLSKVQLWETIEAKGGLGADMDGLMLSHGQKQLFCLARAMLRDSKILILDEAMSTVDAETDAIIGALIKTDFHDHTVISISHKLEGMMGFDKVGLLDSGVLVEFDSPANLLAWPSTFKKLYEGAAAVPAAELEASTA